MKLNQLIDQFMCWLGFHDFQVLEITFGFGEAGDVEKVECNRCRLLISREKRR
jgi:hypothetical protein